MATENKAQYPKQFKEGSKPPVGKGKYHPVGTDFHLQGHNFKVVGIDHENKSYTLQHHISGAKTQHHFDKIHAAFKPKPLNKAELKNKITLIKSMLEALAK